MENLARGPAREGDSAEHHHDYVGSKPLHPEGPYDAGKHNTHIRT